MHSPECKGVIVVPIVQLWEFKDKGQKTEDRGWWLLNAKRLPAQYFVFCPLSFVLQRHAVGNAAFLSF